MKTLVTIFLAAFLSTGALAQDAKPALVGKVKDTNAVQGCGCYVQLPADRRNRDKFIFMGKFGGVGEDERFGVINVDGQDVRLKFLKTTRPKRKLRRGDKYSETYEGDAVAATLDFTVAKTPQPGEEVTDYRVTVTAAKGDRKQVIKAVANCGC